MLDFDNTDLDFVKFWSRKALRWFKLGGFIILESSAGCFHVVFDRSVSWSENMSIVASITLRSHNSGLRRWQLMQCRKQSATLRISPKCSKPVPKIIYFEGSQEHEIAEYLRFRGFVNARARPIKNGHNIIRCPCRK
jgi:hypothetical protein